MTAPNVTQAAALTLVDEFTRCGVAHACLAPGSRSAPLALALADDDRIEVHVSLDERSAAFVAVGIGRATRRPAIVLSTSGTAAANFLPAVQEAARGRVPLLVLTADRPPELRDTGANQWIDQIKLYGDSVRWFCEVGPPEALATSVPYWRSTAARAVTETTGSPPGPVHLNLAFREPLVPNEPDAAGFLHSLAGRAGGAPWVRVESPPRRLRTAAADALAAEIGGRRGLIVAGAGSFANVPAHPLAALLGWPLLADPLSNLRTADDVISTYDALLRHEPFVGDHRPDVVLRIGALGISKALQAFVGGCTDQVLVDSDGAWLDPDRSTSRIIAAEPRALFEDLIERAPDPAPGAWLDAWRRADSIARRALDGWLDAHGPTEPRIARDVVAGVPDGSSLLVGASMPFRDVEWFARPRTGIRFYGNRGVNGIDGFPSTALGVALATREPTYALCGDLSLLHDHTGFMTAARANVDLTFVVVNNDGGGIFSFLPQASLPEHFEKLFGTPQGIDFGDLAALHGCNFILAATPDDLENALKPNGVTLVELRTDRADNVRIHRTLNTVVAQALGQS
ncbi:MAG: 2-succinyl-5-enolpyruvyl-6-hydroxy-3-cyclohexene-1-carboxylic-acid synthase [Actinomycetota bacterium]